MRETGQKSNKNEQAEDLLDAVDLNFVEMVAAGATMVAISEKLGIPYMTVRRWKKRPEIIRAVRERAKEAVHAGAMVLSHGVADASSSLVKMSKDAIAANAPQITACRAVIEFSLKIVEYDELAERLEQVEAKLAEKGNDEP